MTQSLRRSKKFVKVSPGFCRFFKKLSAKAVRRLAKMEDSGLKLRGRVPCERDVC